MWIVNLIKEIFYVTVQLRSKHCTVLLNDTLLNDAYVFRHCYLKTQIISIKTIF